MLERRSTNVSESSCCDIEKKFEFNELLNNKVHYKNLIIMNIAWSSTSFGYYLISYYLKYIPGDIYTNIILASLADMFSSFFSAHLS